MSRRAQIEMEEKKKVVTLTLTQSCNLSCSYCYETNKTSSSMSYNTAQKIIDYEFAVSPDNVLIEIDFFGGEPFLEFELMSNLVDYVKNRYGRRKYLFFVITNGTLLNSRIKSWLLKNKDCLICGLSFDGTKEMQNTNRSNSYDMVDLDFFAQQYPEQSVKMTISNNTLSSLAEGVLYLQSKGFEVSCNLAYGIDWSDTKYQEILYRELNKLITYYLSNPEVPICSMLDMDISRVAFYDDNVGRYCGAGIDMVSYDVDGRSYPCQMFMPLSAGIDKAENASKIKFFEDIIPNELVDSKCKECVIKAICPTCYGSNYIATGSIYIHEQSYCHLMKIIMKARSYLKGKLWEQNRVTLNNAEEQFLLKSISILQEMDTNH